MNLIELQRSLRQLRLGGMAAVLETRLHQAQAEPMAPIDLLATLVNDELTRRSDRLLERRRKQASFRDPVWSENWICMKMRYFAYCGSADAIMGFEYAESARPIPIFADRCLRVDEPPPTAGH